jgi:ABC-type nitrate/sulfonate/bicarbonate transport system ATPase subunit
MKDSILSIQHLSKAFFVDGKEVQVLKDINLDLQKGEFITIVGHSGCGKSTLLKIIAGLVDYQEGTVVRNGSVVTEPGIDCGMMFQDHRLMPWLRVESNVGFGLKNLPKAERQTIIARHLDMVDLKGFAKAWPHQLSGGMAQRVAIARGLVTDPPLLLLDEPLGALDALTRIQMQKEILRIWKDNRTTMVLVTHDIDEAIFLGERVVVMSARPGEISEILDIPAGMREDRGSPEFAYYKGKILKHFFAEERRHEEYTI